jgi:hypothetical protein
MVAKRSSLEFGLFIVDRFESGCLIPRAILIRCQDYRKALPTADAIVSTEESEESVMPSSATEFHKETRKRRSLSLRIGRRSFTPIGWFQDQLTSCIDGVSNGDSTIFDCALHQLR